MSLAQTQFFFGEGGWGGGAVLFLQINNDLTRASKPIIKISSLLNVSNSSSKSKEFSVKDIEVLKEDIKSRTFLQAEGGSVTWTPQGRHPGS